MTPSVYETGHKRFSIPRIERHAVLQGVLTQPSIDPGESGAPGNPPHGSFGLAPDRIGSRRPAVCLPRAVRAKYPGGPAPTGHGAASPLPGWQAARSPFAVPLYENAAPSPIAG